MRIEPMVRRHPVTSLVNSRCHLFCMTRATGSNSAMGSQSGKWCPLRTIRAFILHVLLSRHTIESPFPNRPHRFPGPHATGARSLCQCRSVVRCCSWDGRPQAPCSLHQYTLHVACQRCCPIVQYMGSANARSKSRCQRPCLSCSAMYVYPADIQQTVSAPLYPDTAWVSIELIS